MEQRGFTKIRTVRLHWIFLALSAVPVIAQAQFRVTGMAPRQNEINVAVTSPISVTFSNDLEPATLDETTWSVYGSQTGFISGSISYDAPARTATFTPDVPFKEGELISTVLTSLVRSVPGRNLQPFQASFTAAVEFGTGIFDERAEIPLGPNFENPTDRDPYAVCAGDFNSDTYVDLAVVNNTTNSVSILLNEFFSVNGTLRLDSSAPVGNGPTALTAGDFDKDELLDLAVSNFDENTITVLRNAGRGRLATTQSIPTHEHPTQLEARDFNNDGQMDLAVVVLGVNRLQVFLNLGDGSFTTAANTYATGASPHGLAAGDFDNDGDVDLVVANSGDNSIIVYRNDGRANFTNSGETSVPDFPTVVRTGDLSGRTTGEYGDGLLDLVLVHPNINEVSVFVNRSRDGGFALQERLDAGLHPTDAVIADVDTFDNTALATGFGKDHDLDFAVPNLFSNDVFLFRNQFNNGFAYNAEEVQPAGETPVSIAGADFDRDGDMDLAVANLTVHGVSILLNQGGRGDALRLTDPSSLFDFGQVYVGTDSTRNVRLYNPTEAPVTIDEISANMPQFRSSISQATIEPGALFNFDITFSPTDTVVYQDTLTIRGNLTGEQQELKVALRGEGIIAIISVVPDTLEFGRVLPPETATLPIQITNSGNGALNINRFEFTDAAFSTQAPRVSIPPYSTQPVDISFAPTTPFVYIDTLAIHSNDSLNTPTPVILLAGPNDFPPQITSVDTVTATEDIFFTYTATSSDSDGTQARFLFEDLPGWLRPSSNDIANVSVEGTPLEGDLDTTFTVIALDGMRSDTLAVYVRVIPVNDPPQFDPISDFTTTELERLSFNLSASDPEDSTLTFAAPGLPAGAVLTENANNTATFSWIPPAGSRGVYTVPFIVSEVYETPPLSDTVVVQIEVVKALPDLVAAPLSVPTTDVAEGQTIPVTGVVRADFSTVDQPFRLTFYHNREMVRDTVITQLAIGEELAFVYQARMHSAGDHEIAFEVDAGEQIVETNEENNFVLLLFKARKPELVVRPNPFTPNSDGYNDLAVFDFSDLTLETPELQIFNFRGQPLATLRSPLGAQFRWDGRDERGKHQQPGLYLYILSDGGSRVMSGYVVLAR